MISGADADEVRAHPRRAQRNKAAGRALHTRRAGVFIVVRPASRAIEKGAGAKRSERLMGTWPTSNACCERIAVVVGLSRCARRAHSVRCQCCIGLVVSIGAGSPDVEATDLIYVRLIRTRQSATTTAAV